MTLPMIIALAVTVLMIILIMVDKLPFGAPPLLALLLPLSGASRRKEPFATLLVVPMIVLIVLLALQLMRALGVALPFQPVSGCTMMIECTFLSFMTVQAIRTKT